MTRPARRPAFAVVTALFFMWGFITCMNDLLIPKFKAGFALSQLQANLVLGVNSLGIVALSYG